MDTNHPSTDPNDENIKILCTESNPFKRKVKEALYIKVNNPTLNQNIGKYNIPAIYDQILNEGGGGKLLLSSKWHMQHQVWNEDNIKMHIMDYN